MQHTPDVLTPEDRLALLAFLRERRMRIRLRVLFMGLAVFGGLVLWLSAVADVTTWLAVVLPAGGIGLWSLSWLVSKVWPCAPVQEALASGHKTITRGSLIHVEPEQPDHVVYRLEGGVLTLRPLGGFDIGAPSVGALLLERHSIRSFVHAPTRHISVHWVPTRDGRGLALRVDYDDLPIGTHDTVAADPTAIARAHRTVRRNLAWLGVSLAIAGVTISVLNGFALATTGLALSMLAVAFGLMMACAHGWSARAAKRQPAMEVVTGPVTELLVFHTRHQGRAHASSQHWCRIGGILLPRDLAWPEVRLGQILRVELLRGEGPGGTCMVGSVTVADPQRDGDTARIE